MFAAFNDFWENTKDVKNNKTTFIYLWRNKDFNLEIRVHLNLDLFKESR
jgi:hypothetical protein